MFKLIVAFLYFLIRDHLRKIWINEKEFMTALSPVLGSCDMEHPTDSFFLDMIPVPPPKVRPVSAEIHYYFTVLWL
jgi:DNA-directed RNA polymerase beta' subunit